MAHMRQTLRQLSHRNETHSEGPVAKAIEQTTARLPSDTFLWAAIGSIGISAALQSMGHREQSIFVGQWVPTFLLLGIYNKIVKVMGSEGRSIA